MQNILQRQVGKAKKYTRCKNCGDIMNNKREAYCNQCLGYNNAWMHIQRVKECLEGVR